MQHEAQQLVCPQHGAYPIVEGIPSFCAGVDSFDHHWMQFKSSPLAGSKLAEARRFLAPVLKDAAGAAYPLRLLDAGCGDGVHVAALAESAREFSFAAVDISFEALQAARGRGRSGWRFMHADIASLPFDAESFDAVFSYGVVAYTRDPSRSIRELVRVTRPGGLVGIWVYPARSDFLGRCFALARGVVTRLPPFLQRRIADLFVPVLGLLPTASGLSLANGTWRQCREVILVNLAPPELRFFTQDELRGEMEDAGLEICLRDAEAPITLWGRR